MSGGSRQAQRTPGDCTPACSLQPPTSSLDVHVTRNCTAREAAVVLFPALQQIWFEGNLAISAVTCTHVVKCL